MYKDPTVLDQHSLLLNVTCTYLILTSVYLNENGLRIDFPQCSGFTYICMCMLHSLLLLRRNKQLSALLKNTQKTP